MLGKHNLSHIFCELHFKHEDKRCSFSSYSALEIHALTLIITITSRKTTQPILNHLCLRGDSRLGVGDLNAECLGLRNDLDSLSRRNGVCDLCCVCSVVHEEEFNIFGVVDEECFVARWHHVSCLLVRAKADL